MLLCLKDSDVGRLMTDIVMVSAMTNSKGLSNILQIK